MATFSQFQQPLENPVHWGSSRRLVENGELPRRLFLLSVVYGRTWQTHALLLSSVITCAMYSVCDYVLHWIVYFLMPFSVLPSSLLGPVISGEEPHVYTQVLSCASAMPPPLSSLLTFQSFFFPTLLVLLTLAKFLVLWKELGYSQIWGLRKGLCWVSLSVWTVGVCVSSSRDCNNSWRLLFLLAQNWDTFLPLALKYVCINLLWAASDPVTTCSWPQQRSSSG